MRLDYTRMRQDQLDGEHGLRPEVIDRLIRFVKFIEVCPRGGTDLVKDFSEYCDKEGTKKS